jgi:hypothetical protein
MKLKRHAYLTDLMTDRAIWGLTRDFAEEIEEIKFQRVCLARCGHPIAVVWLEFVRALNAIHAPGAKIFFMRMSTAHRRGFVP